MMSKSRKLTRQQLAVLEDLFTGELSEDAVIGKHGVSHSLYERWLADERFASQVDQRIDHAYRRSRIILARNAADVASRLAKLAREGQGETARKACLDIINLQDSTGRKISSDAPSTQEGSATANLTPETASRLLAAMAGQT